MGSPFSPPAISLARVSSYRARARIPAAVWRHPRTGAVMMRSSQPRPGVLGNTRCAADEELIRAAGMQPFCIHNSFSIEIVFDASFHSCANV
jgi:hypothetical protein